MYQSSESTRSPMMRSRSHAGAVAAALIDVIPFCRTRRRQVMKGSRYKRAISCKIRQHSTILRLSGTFGKALFDGPDGLKPYGEAAREKHLFVGDYADQPAQENDPDSSSRRRPDRCRRPGT